MTCQEKDQKYYEKSRNNNLKEMSLLQGVNLYSADYTVFLTVQADGNLVL